MKRRIAYTPFCWSDGASIGPDYDKALKALKNHPKLEVIPVLNVTHHVIYPNGDAVVNEENAKWPLKLAKQCEIGFLNREPSKPTDYAADGVFLLPQGANKACVEVYVRELQQLSEMFARRSFFGKVTPLRMGAYALPTIDPTKPGFITPNHEPFLKMPAMLRGYSNATVDDGNEGYDKLFKANFEKIGWALQAGYKPDDVFLFVHPNTIKGVLAPLHFNAQIQSAWSAQVTPLIFVNPTATDLHKPDDSKKTKEAAYVSAFEAVMKGAA